MNPKRTRRVGELGAGIRARKIVKLALRHPKNQFEGVDIYPTSRYGQTLLREGQHTKPANLEVRPNTDALEFLRKKESEYFSHVYAHFVIQKFPFRRRQTLIREIKRSMRPGARFTMVEEVHWAPELKKEFEEAGFQVHVRKIGSEELRKLATDNAEENATDDLKLKAAFAVLPENLPPEIARRTGTKTKSEYARKLIEQLKAITWNNHVQFEPTLADTIALATLQRIVDRIPERFLVQKPFVVITCKKPR